MKRRNFINMGLSGMVVLPFTNTELNLCSKSGNTQPPFVLTYVKDSALMADINRIKFQDLHQPNAIMNTIKDRDCYQLIKANSILNHNQQPLQSNLRIRLQASIPPPDLIRDQQSQLLSASIDVAYQPYHNELFHAWYYDAQQRGIYNSYHIASPITFTSCIHQQYGLNFIVSTKIKMGEAIITQQTPICLSPVHGLSHYRLQRGIYMIMFHGSQYKSNFNLNQYSVFATKANHPRNGVHGSMMLIHTINQNPVNFPYIVICIDQADEVNADETNTDEVHSGTVV